MFAHHRQHRLTGQQATLQIDLHDPIESFFGDHLRRSIARSAADIVVQKIDPPPGGDARFGIGLAVGSASPIRGNALRLAAFLRDHRRGLLGARQVSIHQQHLGAFAGEQHGRGAPVPDRVSGRLPGTDHDAHLVLQPHRCCAPGK